MSQNDVTKVLIADDHLIFSQGLEAMLRDEENIRIVGIAVNGNEVIQHLEKNQADVVIMDIMMPEMDGYQATNYVVNKFPEVNVLIFTGEERPEYIMRLLNTCSSGYLLKGSSYKKQFLVAIHAVTNVAT